MGGVGHTQAGVLFSSLGGSRQRLQYCFITFRAPEQPDESTHQGTSVMMSQAAEHSERGLCSICDNWTENWSKSQSRGENLEQEGVKVSERKESLNETRGFNIRCNLLHILDMLPASVVSRQRGQTCRCGWVRTHKSAQCKQHR